MTAYIPFDTMELVPSADVATNGTMAFTYPSGNASRYAKSGETLVVEGLQISGLAAGASTFTLSYGASTVTVTWKGSTSIPAGTRVKLQAPRVQKVGVYVLPIYINLASIAGAGDVLTNYIPGHNFKILSTTWQQMIPVTTGAKAATLNLEIGTTDLTGGTVALTSATCTPLGAQIAGAAITAGNVGTDTDSFSIEAASVTAFAEGTGTLLIEIQNTDTLNEYNKRYWS